MKHYTPSRLLQLAEEYERQGRALLERASTCREEAARLAEVQEQVHRAISLDKLVPDMHHAQLTGSRRLKNLAISRARGENDELKVAANAKGWSMRELAVRVGISPAALFHYRSKGQSGRAAPRRVVDKIERLVGFSAVAENWPNGIAEPTD